MWGYILGQKREILVQIDLIRIFHVLSSFGVCLRKDFKASGEKNVVKFSVFKMRIKGDKENSPFVDNILETILGA